MITKAQMHLVAAIVYAILAVVCLVVTLTHGFAMYTLGGLASVAIAAYAWTEYRFHSRIESYQEVVE